MADNNLSEYYRKSSNMLKLVRYIVLLLFILFLLSCIFIFRNDITLDNIQYLMKYADFYDSASTSDNSEISVSADNDSYMFMLRDNLAVVSRSGIGLYEFTGRKLFNYNYSYSNPGVSFDDRNILVYDITGNELSVFNSFSRVFTQKYPYSVKNGVINQSGFAIVTSEKTYRSGVICYDSDFKEVFRWMSADRYVTALDLDDTCSNVVVGAVTTKDGSYDSKILIYNTKTGKVDFETTLTDELPLTLKYSDNSSEIILVTDSMVHFYDSKLQNVKDYKYNQSKIDKYYLSDDMLILSESNNLSGNSMSLIGFDYGGNQLFNENADSKITDVAVGKNKIYAVSNQYIYSYDRNPDGSIKTSGKKLTSSQYKFILADTSDRYIVADTNSAVRNAFEASDEENKTENKQ